MKKLFVLILLSGCGPFAPMFARWSGEADLAQAEGSKKVQIEDAKGKLESAKLLSLAEVERAKGVAEANKIIGDSLKGNESYLRYLWISNLEKAETKGSVIYVPTEGGLPILEAGKRE
jgi:regulator of protease activity HflC (stomatin/prohibitin superfamily)